MSRVSRDSSGGENQAPFYVAICASLLQIYQKKKWLVETFGGRCAEMEGAAIGHVAVLNKVPYLVVRAISDKADDSAEMDYPTFAAKAIENSVNMMTEIIKRYEVK